MLRAIRETRLLWPALAALAGFAFLVALGNWQMRRLDWKQGLIGSIAERQHATPVTLALAEERASLGGDVEYTRVKVEGQLLNDREIHLYALDDKYGPGFHVITPLRLADGSIVLVNRGFVPNDLKDAGKRAAGQVAGDVTFTGLLRHADEQTMFVPANDLPATSGTGATSTPWQRRSAPTHRACTSMSSTPKPNRRRRAAGRRAASPASSCPTVISSTR